MTISTNPAGAACELTRRGLTVGAVNPTPGSVLIDKSSDDISVICSKEGFQDAAGTLDSEFAWMTFGNILFGGIIGVGIDAASGAMNEYPASVSITMIEEETLDPASEQPTEDTIVEAPDGLLKPEDIPVS